MPTWLRFVLGTVLTAGLGYASHWLWLWAEKEIKGTPFGDFKFFGSLLAVFALLSLAQLVVNLGTRAFAQSNQDES